MFMRHRTLSCALAVVAMAAASAASAGPAPTTAQIFTAENLQPEFVNGYVVYGSAITDKFNAFKSNLLPSVVPLGFEFIPAGTSGTINYGFSGSGGQTIGASLTGGTVRGETILGRYNTTAPTVAIPEPRRYLEVQTADSATAGSGSQFTISFTRDISAFAFFGTDIGDFDGDLYMDMYLDDQIQTTLTVRNGDKTTAEGQQLLFYGFASPDVAYDKIVFRTTSPSGNDVFGFDDFWAADAGQLVSPPPSPMPEPASLALVGLALAAAGLSRRRKA